MDNVDSLTIPAEIELSQHATNTNGYAGYLYRIWPLRVQRY